ncbi:MAG TPA: SPOR domain-containing protein [Steroidobacteraceae bacterium]
MAQEIPELEDRIKQRLTGAAILIVLVVLVVPAMFRGQRSDAPGRAGGSQADAPHAVPIQRSGATSTPGPAATASPPASAAPAPAAVAAPPPEIEAQPSALATQSPAVTPGKPQAPAAATGWTVQLGSFSQPQNAHHLLQRLSSKGVKPLLVGPDSHGLYRVRTPVLPTRAAAAALQQRLTLQGFPGVISTTQ